MISIDMPAGPSEVLVIADKHASPVHIAADLLSQVFPFMELLVPLNTLFSFSSMYSYFSAYVSWL